MRWKWLILKGKKMKLLINGKWTAELISKLKSLLYLSRKAEGKHDKTYCDVRDYCHYAGEYRSAAHSTCNLKDIVPNDISIIFHNGSKYDYNFIIKELAEEFEKQFNCLGENTEKYINFSALIEKEVTRIIKSGKDIKKLYLIDYNLLIVQVLWHIHCQILFKILLNEFIELNVNKYGHDNAKYETPGVKYKNCESFLEYTNFKNSLIKYKCLCCYENYQKNFDENLKKGLYNIHKFLTMISISLFYCCKNVFTHVNAWVTDKHSVKLYYMKKKIFTVTLTWEILPMQITLTEIDFVKILK